MVSVKTIYLLFAIFLYFLEFWPEMTLTKFDMNFFLTLRKEISHAVQKSSQRSLWILVEFLLIYLKKNKVVAFRDFQIYFFFLIWCIFGKNWKIFICHVVEQIPEKAIVRPKVFTETIRQRGS